MKKYQCLTATIAILPLMAGIFLVACGPAPTGYGGADPVSGAYATIAVAQTATAAVAQANARGTAVASDATAQANAQATEQAVIIAQATNAQATVDSSNMTQVAVLATATEAARLSSNDQARVNLELAARQNALDSAETINKQIVDDNARRLQDEADQRARDANIAYWRGIVVTILLALIGLVVVFFIGMLIVDRAHRIRRREEALKALQGHVDRPTITAPAQAQITATAGSSNGRAAAPGLTVSSPNGFGGQRLAALPPKQRTALLQQHTEALTGHVANWQEFSRWRQPDRVVIGVGVNGPIIFDLRQLPHFFTAGASRKGKSTLVRVLLAYMATSGYNVAILNERSSDFSGLNLPNVMNLRGFSEAQRLRLTQETFNAAVVEMNRRDNILHEAGIPTWREYLLNNPNEAPLLFIFVDEFLELTQGHTAARNELLSGAATLSSQAGKFGIGIGLNATDPTQRALGNIGYGVIQNCARICLGVNTTYASMSMLGDGSAFGLPEGQFVAIDHNGDRHAGLGFHPSPAQLSGYIEQNRPQSVKPFPPALTAVSRIIVQDETEPQTLEVDPELSRVIEDAQLISTLSDSNVLGRAPDSRSAICEYLYEAGYIGWGRTGPNVRRVELALMYLATKGNEWAKAILVTSRSTAVSRDEANVVREMAMAAEALPVN